MTDRPQITPTENGPYRIEGADEIVRLSDGHALETRRKASLCRCGGSQNKPFCDGTHARIGFEGGKDPDRVPDRLDSYSSSDGNITIHDNRGLCAHAGRCTDNLAQVFRLDQEPWVDPDGATAAEIARVVEMCPSGALSYAIAGVEHRDRGGAPTVGYVPAGPYVLTGGVGLVGHDVPDGGTKDHYTLCRCGASQNKPFCSGKHWYVDFDEEADQ